jgi:flagellar hook-length control protein FliK
MTPLLLDHLPAARIDASAQQKASAPPDGGGSFEEHLRAPPQRNAESPGGPANPQRAAQTESAGSAPEDKAPAESPDAAAAESERQSADDEAQRPSDEHDPSSEDPSDQGVAQHAQTESKADLPATPDPSPAGHGEQQTAELSASGEEPDSQRPAAARENDAPQLRPTSDAATERLAESIDDAAAAGQGEQSRIAPDAGAGERTIAASSASAPAEGDVLAVGLQPLHAGKQAETGRQSAEGKQDGGGSRGQRKETGKREAAALLPAAIGPANSAVESAELTAPAPDAQLAGDANDAQPAAPQSRQDAPPSANSPQNSDAHSTGSATDRFSQHLVTRGRPSAEPGPHLREADQARFLHRVARAFEAAQDRGGEIRLRLSPPELGSLRLEVKLQGGALSAHIEADTPQARSLLLDNLPLLRERLAEQNIRVERFDVDLTDRQPGGPDDDPRDARRDEWDPPPGEPRRDERRSAAGDDAESAGAARLRPGSNQLNIVV